MPRALPADWTTLPDEDLLNVRMCDLPVQIDDSLAERTARLRQELEAAGLRAPIHFYLSDEWFTPDGATAIAIPFYMAHPRLAKLEETQMLEVEGGEYEWCMRILRHEAGHALDNAFKLRRQHYRTKRRHYGVDYPNFYDRDLRRLFSDAPEFAGNVTAAQFIGRIRKATRRAVTEWTGIYQYTIDQVIEDMIARSRELKLRLAVPEEQARQEFTVLLTVQTMNHLHSGGHRLFL